jgi:TRAP-type mannitol/chloroaromatic compound transport system permease small subunit
MSNFIPHFQRFANGLDRLNEGLGQAVSWLSLMMVLVTVAVVVLRYVFGMGWIWLQETVTFMHATLFLVGAAYTLKHEGHVRVDIIYRKFSVRGRAWVDLLGTLTLLLPVCLFILYISWDYVVQSWSLYEGSREVGGLEGVFLLKTLILVMALLLILQGLSLAIRCLGVILGWPDTPTERKD